MPRSCKDAGLAPGALVDHYRIIRPLGAGGMAEVHLARDTLLGRKVALKIIRPNSSQKSEAIERFLFEAKVTAQFNHPNIISIHSVGQTDRGPYLALEYLEGQTLRDRLEQERLSVNESIRITKSIADALQVAHKKDLLHRDLKPENVMLAKDGRLRVLDFGLSCLLAGEHTSLEESSDTPFHQTSVFVDPLESKPQTLKGTPGYMAPEQWRAEELGPATDIWALGLILYEMLAGHHPYQQVGQIKELATLVSNESPVPAPISQDHVPFRLQELLRQCLTKDPRRRPSAHELTLELCALLAGDKHQDLTDMSPFRGLVPFEEEHSSLYFGREAEVSSFVERLRTEPILPVVGLSGAGKSSFVKAGVIPRLREKSPLILVHLRPGRQPFLNLASRLIQAWQRPALAISSMGSLAPMGSLSLQTREDQKTSQDALGTPHELAKTFYEKPQLLGLWLHRLSELHRLHVVLFVDQLEELWALPRQPRMAQSSINTGHGSKGGVLDRFMHAICTAADDPQLPVRVILTMREEFLSRLMTSGQVREALSRIMVLRKPSQKTLVDILTQSVKAVGYQFEDYLLAHEMVTDVQDSQSVFSLLQFAGQVLWENRDQPRRVLTRAAFEKMGGVTGALVQHADGVLTGLNVSEVNIAKALLLRLVTENRTKRILVRQDLLAGLQAGAAGVLERLVESRLVIVSRKTAQSSQASSIEAKGDCAEEEEEGDCELVHEALIASWDRLSKWIDESSEELRLFNQLEQAALLWDKRGRRIDELWGLQALQEVEVLREKDVRSNQLLEDFRKASEQRIRRGRQKRISAVASIVVALAVATLIGNRLLKQDLCTGAKTIITSVWNPSTKKGIDRSFLATGVSYARDTLVRVQRNLDLYANHWIKHYTQACEATHLKGDQSDEVLDLRMGCLRERKRDLKALVEIFQEADHGVLQKAIQASVSLASVNVCADEKALRAPYPQPNNATTKRKVSDIRERLATVDAMTKTGKYQKGLKLAQQLAREASKLEYEPIQAEILYRLGSLLDASGDYPAAEKTLYDAARIAGENLNSQIAVQSMIKLVWVVGYQQAQYTRGLELGRAAEIINGLGGNDEVTARLLTSIGTIFWKKAEYDQALSYHRRALAIMEKVLRPDHPLVATTLNNIGLVFSSQGDQNQALDSYRKTLAIRNKTLGPVHPVLAGTLNNMGQVYLKLGEYELALQSNRKALSIHEQALGPGHPYVAANLTNIGASFFMMKEYDKAEQYFRKSLDIREKALGAYHPDVAQSLLHLGQVSAELGEVDKALVYCRKSIAIREKVQDHNHPEIPATLGTMGEVYVAQKKYHKAIQSFERALEFCEKKTCSQIFYGSCLFSLAQVLTLAGEDQGHAIMLAGKAKEVIANVPQADKNQLNKINTWLKDHAVGEVAKKSNKK